MAATLGTPSTATGRARTGAARWFPRTLRGRLALTYAAVVVAVMAVLAAYLVAVARDLYLDRLAQQLVGEARLVGDAVTPALLAGGGVAEVDPLAKRLGALLDARVTIIGADGTVLGESSRDAGGLENHRTRPEVIAARRGGPGIETRRSNSLGEGFLYVAVPVPETGGVVARVAVPLTQVETAMRRVQRDLAIATLAAAGLVAVVGLFVAGRIAGPLDELRAQAGAVAGGRLDVAVEPAATRELSELGRAFNAMTRQLRASRDEIDRARLRLEATLAGLSDGVVMTDQQGLVVRLNAAAGRMLGIADRPVLGQPFLQVSRDHELAALLREALAAGDGPPRQATIELARSRRTIEATARRIAGAGEWLGLVLLRDVTELRRLERMRREFVANVSHELRTPLASIKALVETLEAGAVDDPAVASDFLRRIVGEVDRLAALVDDLLDLARLESGRVSVHPEPLDPADLLARAVERLRPQVERAHLELEVPVSADLPLVHADRARIEQVLLNLIHNAIKFTLAGGTITVDAAATGGELRVTVRDTGVGVPSDELPRLFERFYKADKARRSDGTGLGLAIAKHIVQAHGGTIWAESTPGEGSSFHFTLPLATHVRAAGGPEEPAAMRNRGSGHPSAIGSPTGGRARPAARRRAR